jgi:hypothetical protein
MRGRKKIITREKFDKGYKKDKKYTKKKSYGQAHIDLELNSSDESSESKSDEVATIAIKEKPHQASHSSSSSQSIYVSWQRNVERR